MVGLERFRVVGVTCTSFLPKGLHEEVAFDGYAEDEKTETHSAKTSICDISIN